MLFTNLAAAMSLLGLASATPVVSEVSKSLFKRGESIHLVNCGSAYSAVVVNTHTLSRSLWTC